MDDKYSFKKTFSNTRFLACVSTIFILGFLIALTIIHRSSFSDNTEIIPYDDMWSYETGSLVDFNNMKTDDHFVIHKRTNEDEINNNSLCFYTKNIHFTVYLDGEPIYDFHPDNAKVFGKGYGIYPHSVSIPVIYRDGDIKIAIDNLYEGKAGYIIDMHLDTTNDFMIAQLQKSTPDFLVCLVIFIFGFVLFAISLFGKYFGDARFEIISIGCLAMVASLWIATGTNVYMILTNSPVVLHFVEYIALDLMAYPAVVFASFVTGNKNSKLSIVIGYLTLIKVGTSVVLTSLGLMDYHQLLSCSQILLGITAIIFIYLIVKGIIRKTIKSFITKILIVIFGLTTVFGVIDIIRYIIYRNDFITFSFFKYALFLFIFMSGLYEYIAITEMSKRGKYAEIMEELAYQDDLTGLLNRKAFNKKANIISDGETIYTLIMMDLNYLKRVNDELGHVKGDEYIKYIAKSIAESFANDEGCFRLGGDEFFVITAYRSDEEAFYDSMKNLNSMINTYNKENDPSIKMSIAYGYSEFNPKTDSFDEQFKKADQKMYEMKAKMKGR